ncbi:hypothetical protein AB0J90_33590 [Micromonospora sp. NPDC049523]|uniref:hypothetical protein n=1 Tax=Micromonospora sp. NPDC049523 TaxID=3155921 RepID=UPI00343622EF
MLLNEDLIHAETYIPLPYESPDIAGARALVDHLTSVSESEPGTYTGWVELAGEVGQYFLSEEAVEVLGDSAKWLPFEATVDQQGRLTTVAVSVPEVGNAEAYEHTITYTNYGTAPTVTITAPADSMNAPAELYEILAP